MRKNVLFRFFFIVGLSFAREHFLTLEKWTVVPELELYSFFDVRHNVTFDLYTLQNPTTPQVLSRFKLNSIVKSNFNPQNPTRFFIHGWQSEGEMRSYLLDAYLQQGKYNLNVILVNWEIASQTSYYYTATGYVDLIGTYIAEMIDFMIEHIDLKIADVNLIGFSLGAHIAGIAAKNVRSGRIPKIVGLDPASPSFSIDNPSTRLDAHDAEYVEIIHTNGLLLALYDPIGTTDFYPNAGWRQNGCGVDVFGMCSHERAFLYFAESVYSNTPFYGYKCDSMISMKNGDCHGERVIMGGEPGNNNTVPGIYYLTTNDKPLFSKDDIKHNVISFLR